MLVKPPSTGIATPVTKSLSELPKNLAMPAKSVGSPHLPAGVLSRTLFTKSGSDLKIAGIEILEAARLEQAISKVKIN